MILDDDLEEISVLFCSDTTVHLLSDATGGLEGLLELEPCDLFF